MRPDKQKQMMAYLTRPARQLVETGQLKFASDLAKPVDKFEVQQIKLFNDFNTRNPRADGGRIGFKKKGFVNKGGEAEYQRRLKIAQDKFGKDNLDAAAKALGYKDYDALRGEKFANTRKKIFRELTDFGSALPEQESRSRSRVKKRIPKEQGIQIKLIEATNQNKFFNPKTFAEANNISMATLKDQAKRLQTNIYKKRIVEASREIGKETKDKLDWIPNDPKFSDNALKKLWKSKLIKYEREKIDELFFDAFGRKTSDKYNPKKFLAIKKNLNEYRQLRDAINAKYPNINFELDHPLSKSSLNKLFNATTDQLTRVNVLEADLNNGFKDSLSQQYEKAMGDPKKGIKPNLNKKKAVEKIARDLKLNIGKISDDATNFKYGVKEFQKLDMKNEIAKSLENLSSLNKNFQDYAKKNPELFKTANVSTQQTFTQIKPSELKGIQNIIASFGDGTCAVQFGKTKKDGGRIGYATGPASLNACLESGAKNFNDGKFKTADQAQDAAKLLSGGKNVLRAITKYGIIPEVAFVAGESLFRTALGEEPLNALKKSIDSFTFGATDFTSGIEAEKFGKFSDQKLAVDKFRNSQALVNSLQNKLANLKAITDQGGEGYVGDLTSDIQMTQAQLQAAEQELQKNTVSSDIVQFIDRRGQEIADTQMAKSDFAKQSLKDQMEGIPGIRDYTDTESTRIFPSQPSQMDLNLNMFPTLPTDLMQLKTSGAINLAQALREEGQNVSAKDVLAYRDSLKQMPLSEQARIYGDEQTYGTQGISEVPLNVDLTNYQPSNRFGSGSQQRPILYPEGRGTLAGGGIAKMAGVSSGVAPTSGPNPQGLLSLKNRVRNY
jgi:hypothetical protein